MPVQLSAALVAIGLAIFGTTAALCAGGIFFVRRLQSQRSETLAGPSDRVARFVVRFLMLGIIGSVLMAVWWTWFFLAPQS